MEKHLSTTEGEFEISGEIDHFWIVKENDIKVEVVKGQIVSVENNTRKDTFQE